MGHNPQINQTPTEIVRVPLPTELHSRIVHFVSDFYLVKRLRNESLDLLVLNTIRRVNRIVMKKIGNSIEKLLDHTKYRNNYVFQIFFCLQIKLKLV